MIVDDFIWVILAAGNSTRLGQPKQLLQLGSQSLIPHKIMATVNTLERGLKPWLLANQHRVPIHYFIWPHAAVDLDTKSQWQTIQHQENWHVNTQH